MLRGESAFDGMQPCFVQSRLGRTCYWVSRQNGQTGRALVFLHGLTADHRLFSAQMAPFRAGHTVLVWDAPGHGASRPYRDFSYANLAQELKRILDAEKVEKAVLVGQSMGGFVAQSFLARWPERVTGFVGIDTCPYGPRYYSRSDLFWLRQMKWMTRLYPDKLLRTGMAKQCGATQPARENMMRMLENYSYDELCTLMYLGFAGFIPEIADVRIDCPVTLILGEKDRTGKVRQYNLQWHERERYPLYILPGAAHNANDDAPGQVNAILEDFLCALGWREPVHR
ncbi:MAG: alpha/beta fold hydrolase [Gemmiger sp.]